MEDFDIEKLFEERDLAVEEIKKKGEFKVETGSIKDILYLKNNIDFQIYRYGFTEEQIIDIFNSINKWLPLRYQWIMSSVESIPSGQETYANGMPMQGKLYRKILEKEKIESTPSRYKVDVFDQVGMEKAKDAKRLKDSLMIETRCMIDLKAECSIKCKIDKIQNDHDISLYGCRDHGIIHVCVGNRSTCNFGHVNDQKNILCVYSRRNIDTMVISTKSYNIRKDPGYNNSFGSIDNGSSILEENNGKKNLDNTMEDYDSYDNIYDYDDDHDDYDNEQTEEQEECEYVENEGKKSSYDVGKEDKIESNKKENYHKSNNRHCKKKGILERRQYVHGKMFVRITNKELNEAMVRSASKSGMNCVVAPLAAQIIIERFFKYNEDKKIGIAQRIDNREKRDMMKKNILFQNGDLDGVLLDFGFPSTGKEGDTLYQSEGNSSNDMYVSLEYINRKNKATNGKNVLFSKSGELVSINKSSKTQSLSLSPEVTSNSTPSPNRKDPSPLRTIVNNKKNEKGEEEEIDERWILQEEEESEKSEEECWDNITAEETMYAIDPYKETQASKMTWESIRRGITPTFLVEGSNEEKINIKKHLEEGGADALERASAIMADTPYSVPLGMWTQGEGVLMSPVNKNIRSINSTYGTGLSNSSPSSSLLSGTVDTVPKRILGGSNIRQKGRKKRRMFDSPLRSGSRSYSLSSDGTHEGYNSTGERRKSILNQEIKQYYLISEEKANSTKSRKNRENMNKRKRYESLSKTLLKSKMRSNVIEESLKGAIEVSSPMITGSMAEVLMGKPSIESMRGIAMSENIRYNYDKEKISDKKRKYEEQNKSYKPEEIVIVGNKRKNMLSLSRGLKNRNTAKIQYDKKTMEKEELYVREDPMKKKIDENDMDFKKRYQIFLRWIEQNSLIKLNDLESYISSVKSIMNDLIFDSNKRKSMKVAYRIASMVKTSEEIKKTMTFLDKDIRPIRKEEEQSIKHIKRIYKKEFFDIKFSPMEYIKDYCQRNVKELGPSSKTFLQEIDKYSIGNENSSIQSKKEKKKEKRGIQNNLRFLRDEEDLFKYKYGKTSVKDICFPAFGNGIQIPFMTDIDDIYAENIQKHYIPIIPNNEEKQRKYSNEIVRLWVILLSCENVKLSPSPKSQFDHFVLGVLYILSYTDICIDGKVIIEKDEWLQEALPPQKRLCENYINKLKRKDVAEILKKYTDLEVDMLKFSTKRRSYTSKIVTKGKTKVKNWTNDYNGLKDIDCLRKFIKENSQIQYIKVSKSVGNTNNKRFNYNRGKSSLFK